EIFERPIEAKALQKLPRFGEQSLGLVAQAEQSFFASGKAACFGYCQYFVRCHVRLHTRLGICPERAIAAIIPTKVGEWNKDLPGVADRPAFEAVPYGRSHLEHRLQRGFVHQRKCIFARHTATL